MLAWRSRCIDNFKYGYSKLKKVSSQVKIIKIPLFKFNFICLHEQTHPHKMLFVFCVEFKWLYRFFGDIISSNLMKLALIAILCVTLVSAQTACTNIPADHVYYLTSFCDQTTACGKSCGNCNFYYAADSQRFKCGSTINCARSGKNANLEVIDYGPNCDLEKKSGKPIIDASYSTCKLFTGSTSCGWSDKLSVTCVKVGTPALAGKLPLGECTWDPERTDLPFCHLEENKHKYTQSNIHEWVELQELREIEAAIFEA